jgi:hypothetical protein
MGCHSDSDAECTDDAGANGNLLAVRIALGGGILLRFQGCLESGGRGKVPGQRLGNGDLFHTRDGFLAD